MTRKHIAAWFIALLTLPAVGQAQTAASFETVSVGATAVGLLSATRFPGGGGTQATFCVASIETAPVRMRLDSGTPTSSVGMPLAIGDVLYLQNTADINHFLAIRSTSTSAAMQFTCGAGTEQKESTIVRAMADVGVRSVTNGGTGLAVGVSGGVPGFTSTTGLASSVALTNHALVVGGGAGATPTPLGSLGSSVTLLHGNASGDPSFGAVSLSADVTGTLPNANLYGNGTPTRTSGQFGTGTTATIEVGSIDFAGRITIGTGGAASGAITFGGTYTLAPHCTAVDETTPAALATTTTTTTVTITGTMTAADTVVWVCR